MKPQLETLQPPHPTAIARMPVPILKPSPVVHPVIAMTYGGAKGRQTWPIAAGSLHRLERGRPFYRRGTILYATPQFRTSPLYSQTAANAQLQTTSTSPVQIGWPTSH